MTAPRPAESLPTISDKAATSFAGLDVRDYPGWGMDGKLMHGMSGSGEAVPIERWCISREDLVFLRVQLQRALFNGVIRPTELDEFTASDDIIGPNMYTVCEQYIKPLTLEAGSMSWALLRNPTGLQCDLFITHAWIEGIYEFIDKVLGSWPAGKASCYVCLLSNPQNLDISSLIHSPRSSPFALCLSSATHMLVTPNHNGSIYSRLWCVYEAWMACEMGKVILTATPRRDNLLRNALLLLCLPFLCGFVINFMGFDSGSGCPDIKFHLQLSLFVILLTKLLGLGRWMVSLCVSDPSVSSSMCMSRYPVWWAVDILGAWWSGMTLGAEVHTWTIGCVMLWSSWPFRLCQLVVVLYFFASELERVKAVRSDAEASQLQKNFQSVALAECSNPDDVVAIKAEIGQDMSEVDMSISVLMSAGMSTPDLRQAALLGASVDDAGYTSATGIVVSIGFWLLGNFLFFSVIDDKMWYLIPVYVFLKLLILLAYVTLFYKRRRRDQRAFMFSASSKMCIGGLMLMFVAIPGPEEGGTGTDLMLPFLTMEVVFLVPALLLSYLGVVRLARIPGCGPVLAGLVGPGSSCSLCKRVSSGATENDSVHQRVVTI
eukprot:TRINITY_DN4239_c0_g2_i1.p1 TRINITY_DN4239_c0_g2~~TRINITY_DN4239_c0_g2_i1.p1  ORF type:complete len:602 (+),score=63.19 TRINITY_DN4239_c0_g2_i1:62-1867(+)